MLLLSRAVHVYVATAPCNLRKSFEGLTNEVRQVLAKDPLSGHVFVFLNRRKTQVEGRARVLEAEALTPGVETSSVQHDACSPVLGEPGLGLRLHLRLRAGEAPDQVHLEWRGRCAE